MNFFFDKRSFRLFSIPLTITGSTDSLNDVDARVLYGIDFGRKRGFIRTGDPVIIVTGWKQGAKFTNNFKLVYVDND